MNRRHVIAAAAGVAALAGGVGGWMLWVGRSPFRDRPAASAPGAANGSAATPGDSTPEIVGAGRLVWTLAGHTAPPVSLVVSRDGTKALSGGGHGDGAVRVWDIQKGQPLARFTGHGEKCDVLAVAFGADGATAISAAGPADDSLRVWDLATGQERTQLSGDIGFLFRSISDDGTLAIAQEINAQGRSKGFSLWGVVEGRRIVAVDAPDHASAVAISPADDAILSGGEDGSLTLWKVPGGEKIRSFVGHGPGTTVRTAAFARAGRLLVTSGDGPGAGAGPSRAVVLWDPETGVSFRTIRNATLFALADDGRTLAVAGDATSIRVLDVITARELARLEGHAGGVTALAFAPGGKRLVSAGHDRTVRVWALQEPTPNDRTQ
jgi:WD40 repeat protein